MDPDFERYQACILHELRHLVYFWVLGVRNNWKTYTGLGLPEPHPDYPLPPGFLFKVDCKISETMEWIHEYDREQIHHRHPIKFGFAGCRGAAASWKVSTGNILLARFEIPRFIYTDPTFVVTPDLIFSGILESLAAAAPAEVRSSLDTNWVWGCSDPYYVEEYELCLARRPIQSVGCRLAQPCHARGRTTYSRYPGPLLCPAHSQRSAQRVS
ncbi:hypothetical protein DFH09DRAFT_1327671 [Mycena vulgaris]|nr:hypothetical protein DFH09DRAFT_1327671 [Mycena vulgaris]